MLNILCLLCFTGLLATGQLIFKYLGLRLRGQSLLDGFVNMLTHGAIYGAILLYGLATILWIWILSRVPLSQAYPWVALGIVLVPIFSMVIFGERVNGFFWIGAALIVTGVILTQFGIV